MNYWNNLFKKFIGFDRQLSKQGRIQGGARGAAPIIFSQETELRPEGPKKKIFETGPPLSHGLDDLPPPPI